MYLITTRSFRSKFLNVCIKPAMGSEVMNIRRQERLCVFESILCPVAQRPQGVNDCALA